MRTWEMITCPNCRQICQMQVKGSKVFYTCNPCQRVVKIANLGE